MAKPSGPLFDPSQARVIEIMSDKTARALVLEVFRHYSGTYPAARFRFGLVYRNELAGVAVFSVPTNYKTFKGLPNPKGWVDLGRLVLAEDTGANAESWFLARCLRALQERGVEGVVTMSDPTVRGALRGHTGAIYQALGAVYVGRATPRTLRVFDDGTVFNARTRQKIATGERGWRTAVDVLVAHGARPLEGDPVAWVNRELPRVTHTEQHPGNHKYLFPLSAAARRAVPAGLPYPKHAAAPAIESRAEVRHNPGMAKHTMRFYVAREPLDRQGYTKQGRYFGVGRPLYRYYSDDTDGYIRAADLADARDQVRRLYPEARFSDGRPRKPAGTRANPTPKRKPAKAKPRKAKSPAPGHRTKDGRLRFKNGRVLGDGKSCSMSEAQALLWEAKQEGGGEKTIGMRRGRCTVASASATIRQGKKRKPAKTKTRKPAKARKPAKPRKAAKAKARKPAAPRARRSKFDMTPIAFVR